MARHVDRSDLGRRVLGSLAREDRNTIDTTQLEDVVSRIAVGIERNGILVQRRLVQSLLDARYCMDTMDNPAAIIHIAVLRALDDYLQEMEVKRSMQVILRRPRF